MATVREIASWSLCTKCTNKMNCLTKKKNKMETENYRKAVNNAVELIKAGDYVSDWDACGIGEEMENEAWSEAWRIVNNYNCVYDGTREGE